MARLFDDALSQYLAGTPPVTAPPFTVACWVNFDSTGVAKVAVTIGYNANNFHWLSVRSDDDIEAVTRAGGGVYNRAVATASGAQDTWEHITGVWAASDDRRCYLDGGNKGTDSGSATPTAADDIEVAARYGYGYWSGAIAELGIWSVALTDAEVAVLAQGYSPLFVRLQNLVAYWPLIRDTDDDIVGGYSLTPANGPTVAGHCPVIYPGRMLLGVPTAAPPAAAALPVLSAGGEIHSLVFGGVTVR